MRVFAGGRLKASGRNRRILVLTLVFATIVLLGLISTRGTFALWSASATVGAGTVRSGSATIAIGSLPSLRAPVLGPGGANAGAFTVSNTGSVDLDMRVTTTSTSVSGAGSTPASTVLGGLTLHLSAVGSASGCKTGLGGASGALASFDTGSGYFTLPAGAKATACLEVDLAQNAPQSVAGAEVAFTVTVTGTQVRS